MIGSRAFQQELTVLNPGDSVPTPIMGDLFRKGRNTDPGMDEEGTLILDWVLLTPPGTTIAPLAEVTDPVSGNVFWAHGPVDHVRSLLRGVTDHLEVRLKSVYRIRTIVDIVRDTDLIDHNDLGDPIDTDASDASIPPERTDVPAALAEVAQIEPTDTDLRTLTTWVGWLPNGTDVRIGDALRTLDAGLFRVERITAPVLLAFRELRLELSRVMSPDGTTSYAAPSPITAGLGDSPLGGDL